MGAGSCARSGQRVTSSAWPVCNLEVASGRSPVVASESPNECKTAIIRLCFCSRSAGASARIRRRFGLATTQAFAEKLRRGAERELSSRRPSRGEHPQLKRVGASLRPAQRSGGQGPFSQRRGGTEAVG